jgi:methylenetetrahydrofolate dehydrogenase (NADP+) / methenyltetrahydrofolate cyclohydrolase
MAVGKADSREYFYVDKKASLSTQLGLSPLLQKLPETITEKEFIGLVKKNNEDPNVHGILIQLPLPPQVSEEKAISAVSPEKDVDGLHPTNLGRLMMNSDCLISPAALGILELFDNYGIEAKGKHAVIVGNGTLVAKPMVFLMLQRGAQATIVDPKDKDSPVYIKQADILITDMERAYGITGEMVKNGVIVADCGNNVTEGGKVVGDVNFNEAKDKAAAITPVPGGVGPMLLTCLLKNLVTTAKTQMKARHD